MSSRKVFSLIGVSIMALSFILVTALFVPVPLNLLVSVVGGVGFGLKLGSIIKEEEMR